MHCGRSSWTDFFELFDKLERDCNSFIKRFWRSLDKKTNVEACTYIQYMYIHMCPRLSRQLLRFRILWWWCFLASWHMDATFWKKIRKDLFCKKIWAGFREKYHVKYMYLECFFGVVNLHNDLYPLQTNGKNGIAWKTPTLRNVEHPLFYFGQKILLRFLSWFKATTQCYLWRIWLVWDEISHFHTLSHIWPPLRPMSKCAKHLWTYTSD